MPGKRPLAEYRRKRRFAVTPEPSGRVARRRGRLAFVVQKHRASQLHYDFRLEWNGVLLSWAVPKGPSLDPSVRRLAMPTEDHPLDYAGFEGIIPEGEYGGGTVMVWDRGSWEPEEPDVDAALARGALKFALRGKKLRGSWILVRSSRGGGSAEARAPWFLLKARDEHASRSEITRREPRSALSNRLLAGIARDGGGDVARAAEGDPPARGAGGRGRKPATARRNSPRAR